MGVVWRGLDRTTNEVVAVKVVQKGRVAYDERFTREATVLSELRHPRIVRYITHGATESGDQYLAMEWLEGHDLEQRLADKPLTTAESVRIVAHAAEALAVAHERGVIHRDIKPSNIFLVGQSVHAVQVP